MHVAKEMEREGFTVPLLIGGATTSRTHTAVKIAPAYRHRVVHVQDASRAVGVMGSLVSAELKNNFTEENRGEQDRAREKHSSRKAQPLLSFAEARARKPVYDWSAYTPPRPSFLGVRVYNPVPLEEIVPYIDWTPFFHAWELRGIYPKDIRAGKCGPQGEGIVRRRPKTARPNRERKIAGSARRDRIFPGEQRAGRHRSLRR